MQRAHALVLLLVISFVSCTFKARQQEPHYLKSNTGNNFKQDEKKLNATYSFLIFQYHNNKGDVELARKALDKSIAFDPHSSTLKLEKAQDLYTRGLYASAREELLELKAEDADAERLYIQVLVREGNLSEARVALDSWIESHPKDEDFLSLRTRIEIEDQNVPGAEKLLKKFLANIPDSSQAYLLRGRLRQMQNKEKLALKDYKTALELDSQNISAAAHLAFLQDLTGKQDEALQTYAWLADLTDNPEFHKRLGYLYLERSDTRRAIAALESYARHQPKDQQNLARLAALYLELKDYEQAEYKLTELIKQQPANESLRYYYAAALFELNKKSQALTEVRKISETSSLYSERVRIELDSLWDLGQEKSAKKVATHIAKDLMTKKEKTSEALFSVVYTFLSQKKVKPLAKEILGKALELYPQSPQMRYNHALALDEEGKVKEALLLGQALLKEDSKNPALQNLVGYLLASQGIELKRAETLVESALKHRPDDPFILDSKAWVKFKQNKVSEALSILESIEKLRPDEPIILIHLGDVLAKMGRIKEAMKQYEKALALGIDATHERIRIQEFVGRMQSQPDRKITTAE
ncbi:MAG: tetratricopeptide repeat protein [Bdellovibrionota bacterium]